MSYQTWAVHDYTVSSGFLQTHFQKEIDGIFDAISSLVEQARDQVDIEDFPFSFEEDEGTFPDRVAFDELVELWWSLENGIGYSDLSDEVIELIDHFSTAHDEAGTCPQESLLSNAFLAFSKAFRDKFPGLQITPERYDQDFDTMYCECPEGPFYISVSGVTIKSDAALALERFDPSALRELHFVQGG